jgi:hypothetical protein
MFAWRAHDSHFVASTGFTVSAFDPIYSPGMFFIVDVNTQAVLNLILFLLALPPPVATVPLATAMIASPRKACT